MRWLHITSVVVLIGGVFYAWNARERISPAFRRIVYTAVVTILISGIYNFVMKPSYPPGYHMWFGIKMLLVLHIIAALILLVSRPAPDARQMRSMLGILISGVAVIAISAWLRWISLTPTVKLP